MTTTSSTTRHDLNRMILDLCRAPGGAQLDEVARQVVELIPDYDLRNVLNIAMSAHVRDVYKVDGRRTLNPHSQAATSRNVVQGPSKRRPLPDWQQKLDVLHNIGDGVVKALRSLTIVEVERHIAKLTGQIARSEARLGWYVDIAKAMREHGVDVVADLPAAVLEDLLA